MDLSIYQLVASCKNDMKHIIYLDDMFENLFIMNLVNNEEFEKIQEEFLEAIEFMCGKEFLKEYINICNSAQYLEIFE